MSASACDTAELPARRGQARCWKSKTSQSRSPQKVD